MRVGSRLFGIDLTAQHALFRACSRLHQSAIRLATMRRINRGSDDPAGLIAAGQLEAELTAIRAASRNAARAAGAARAADSALSEVSSLLTSIRGHVIEAAGGALSDAEIAARQLEIDAAVETIDRIAAVTSFGGRKLLDGGVMTFSFSPDPADTVSLALPTVRASALGGAAGRLSHLASGGSASLASGSPAEAIDILDAAQSQILDARARVGAFEKHTIESTARLLGSLEENLSVATSLIYDTDVAIETSRLVQAEILLSAALSTVMIAGRRRGLIGPLVQSAFH